MSQILRVFDTSTKNLGESGEEMDPRCRELIATDESAVVAKSILDAIVVEDSEGDGRFSNPPCTDESDRLEVFRETDKFLNQLIAPETGPGQWRR